MYIKFMRQNNKLLHTSKQTVTYTRNIHSNNYCRTTIIIVDVYNPVKFGLGCYKLFTYFSQIVQ